MSCTFASGNSLGCKDGKGGVKILYVAPWASGAYSPTLTVNVITAWAGAAGLFYPLEVRTEKIAAGHVVKNNKENGTQHWELNGSYVAEKMDSVKEALLANISQNRLLIIFKDANGKYFLHGYNNGVDVGDITATSGTKMEDMNGYNLTWTGKEESQVLELSSGIIAALLAP